MSAVQLLQLACDGPGCKQKFGATESGEWWSEWDLRRVAKVAGWRYEEGKDTCPSCVVWWLKRISEGRNGPKVFAKRSSGDLTT